VLMGAGKLSLVERVALSRDGIQVALKLPLLPTSDRSGVSPSHLGLTRFLPAQMKREDIVSAEPWNLEGYRISTSGPDTYNCAYASGNPCVQSSTH
jgi:hypothetical protein